MFKTRLINAVFTVAIITGVVVMLWIILPRLSKLTSGPSRITSTPNILEQVQALSQLVTVKYVMEKVIIDDDIKWYPGIGENKVLMVAHGIVKAGIDLGEIKQGDILTNETSKKIIIKLPPARVTDTYLDDKHTEIIERSTGLLRSFDKDLEQNARRQAILDINRAAREAGIEKDALKQAKEVLTSFFHQAGMEVEFQSP